MTTATDDTTVSPRTALVVSGGGSRGAFAVGAIEVLKERGYDFDLISGTSTGALIAPLVAVDRVDRLHDIYTQTTTKDVLRKNWLGGFIESIYDTTPLRKLINRELDALDLPAQLYLSHRRILVCTVNLQSGKAEYWSQRPGPGVRMIPDRETLARALLGSSNQPIFTPPVEVPRFSGEQHLDGGLREIAPLSIAIEHGARRIVVIVLCPEDAVTSKDPYRWLLPIGERALDLMTQEIVTNDLKRARQVNELLDHIRTLQERLEEARANGKLTSELYDELHGAIAAPYLAEKRLLELIVIRPLTHLPTNGLDFEPEVMQEMLQTGRDRANTVLDQIALSPHPQLERGAAEGVTP